MGETHKILCSGFLGIVLDHWFDRGRARAAVRLAAGVYEPKVGGSSVREDLQLLGRWVSVEGDGEGVDQLSV